MLPRPIFTLEEREMIRLVSLKAEVFHLNFTIHTLCVHFAETKPGIETYGTLPGTPAKVDLDGLDISGVDSS
jgi:hypothetical protein